MIMVMVNLLKTNSSNSRLFLQDLYTYPTLAYLVYVLTVHTSLVNAIFRNQEYEKSKSQKVEKSKLEPPPVRRYVNN